MKNKLIAAVTVIALGALAVTAFASGDSGAGTTTTQPAAATPAKTATHVRREDRREDRAPDTTTAAPAATPDDHDERGRDHAEDDGIVEVEDHGGHGGNSGPGGGGHGGDDD